MINTQNLRWVGVVVVATIGMLIIVSCIAPVPVPTVLPTATSAAESTPTPVQLQTEPIPLSITAVDKGGDNQVLRPGEKVIVQVTSDLWLATKLTWHVEQRLVSARVQPVSFVNPPEPPSTGIGTWEQVDNGTLIYTAPTTGSVDVVISVSGSIKGNEGYAQVLLKVLGS